MKRRFNCVNGKAERTQRPVLRKSQKPQADGPQPEEVPEQSDAREPAWRGFGANQPESPWDKRLHHPWVWTYRRVHGDSKQHHDYPDSPWDRRLRHPWVWSYRRIHGDPGHK